MQRVRAIIDLSALAHNFQLVKQLSPKSKIIAMVKGNAYGHGMLQAAQVLSGADILAVERPQQAFYLRETNVHTPLIVMAGFLSSEELQAMSAQNIQAVIHMSGQLDVLEQTSTRNPLKIWIKIDTGMHRLGFLPEQLPEVFERIGQLTSNVTFIGCMTHFAKADVPNDPMTEQQMTCFDQLSLPNGAISMANSAAIISRPDTHRDYVRPGIMLYGSSPFVDPSAESIGLKPVMTLQAKLINRKICKKGDTVGYGGTWTCPENMPIGLVSIGYADGYPRHAPNGTPVLVGNTNCGLVGRVSMDFITIDLRDMPDAAAGDWVTLWGNGLSVDVIAKHSGTISYELLSKVTNRVTFEYL